MRDQNEKTPALKLLYVISGVFLSVSVIVLIALGLFVQYQDLKDTYILAEDNLTFLEAECEKYDNYTRGNSARSMQGLLDIATELKLFVSPERLSDSDFLHDFSHTAHVGGIIVLDSDLSPVAQTDMDQQDAYALWRSLPLSTGLTATSSRNWNMKIPRGTLCAVSMAIITCMLPTLQMRCFPIGRIISSLL